MLESTVRKLAPTSAATAEFRDVRIELDLLEPPGLLRMDAGELALALPLRGAWSLRLGGFLHVRTPAGVDLPPQLTNLPVNASLTGLRFEAHLPLQPGRSGDPRPTPGTLRVDPALTLTLDRVGQIDVRSAPAPGALCSLEAKVDVDLLPLLQVNARVEGTVRASVSDRLRMEFDLRLSLTDLARNIPIHTTLERPLPESLASMLSLLQSGQLPKRWPLSPVADPDRDPLPGDPYDLEALAAHVEARIGSHLDGGVASDLVYAGDPAALVCYGGERDSAIWTGHLLAAEAFRYACQGGAARARIGELLAGVERLLQVPEVASRKARARAVAPWARRAFPLDVFDPKGLTTRSALPQSSMGRVNPAYDAPTVDTGKRSAHDEAPTQAELDAKRYAYYSDPVDQGGAPCLAFGRDVDPPSRDQIMGLTLGLACVLRLVGDRGLSDRAAALTEAIASRLDADGWSAITPSGPVDPNALRTPGSVRTFFAGYVHMQLAILRTAATADPERFGPRYESLAAASADGAWITTFFDSLEPLNSYFKFNLDYAAVLILFLLEEDHDLRGTYKAVLETLRAATSAHGNVYFDLIEVLAQGPGEWAGALATQAPLGGTVAEGCSRRLQEWAHRLLRPAGNVAGPNGLPNQKTLNPDYLRGLGRDGFLALRDGRMLARFPLPIHDRHGGDLDFVWQREPFGALDPGKDGEFDVPDDRADVESPGIDFLLPYWMGRFVGLFGHAPGGFADPRVGTAPEPVPAPPPGALTLPDGDLDQIRSWVEDAGKVHGELGRLLDLPALPGTLRLRMHEIVGYADETLSAANRGVFERWFEDSFGAFPPGAWDNRQLRVLEFFGLLLGRRLDDLILNALRYALDDTGAFGDLMDDRVVGDGELWTRAVTEVLPPASAPSARAQLCTSAAGRSLGWPWGDGLVDDAGTLASAVRRFLGMETLS